MIGEEAEITELDPAPALFDNAWRLDNYVYETLLTIKEKKLAPELAESWKETSPTTYVFNLRKGATFSNGRAVTPQDVIGSLERVLDPEAGAFWAVELGPIKSMKPKGSEAVEIELSEPYYPLPFALANAPTSVLPIKELEAGSFDPKTELLGSGPFEVAKHVANQFWLLKRNPHYDGPLKPKLDEIEIRAIPEEAARTAALRSGQIQMALYENPFASESLEGVPGVEVDSVEQPNYSVFEMNEVAKSSPFSDPKVRQAVAYAIDREAVNNLVAAGKGHPSGAAAWGYPESCNPEELPTYERNVDKAKELLTEAGQSNLEFTLLAYNSNPILKSLAEVLQQSLGEAGIKVNIETPEVGKWSEDLYGHNPSQFEASLDTFAGWADPVMTLQYWSPKRIVISQGFSESVPQLEGLIGEAISLKPGAKRKEVIQEGCKVAAENAGTVPLVTGTETVAVRGDEAFAPVPPFEGYAIFTRDYAEYALRGK